MAVPETAVDEDCYLPSGKNDVGRSGQVSSVQPKPESEAVEMLTNRNLRPRVLLANGAHDPRALGWVPCIGH